MRIPDHVLQTVAFVTVPHPDNGETEFVGTAFLVSVPSEADVGSRYNYIVTAGHVADAVKGLPFSLRVNTRNGGCREVSSLTPSGDQMAWHRHKNAFVDVAVYPLLRFSDDIEWGAIYLENFLTARRIRDKDIGIGDEVWCVGLFSLFTGERRNSPIVRTGNVASMPRERIPIRLDDGREGLTKAYLVEMKSMEKLSGSPVFVSHTNMIFLRDIEMKNVAQQYSSVSDEVVRGPSTFHFMGLMHGHWKLPLAEKLQKFLGPNISQLNVGIAVVVPAAQIRDILYHPRLVEMRKAGDAKIRHNRTPSPDATVPRARTQRTLAKEQKDRIDIPVPSRSQFESDLEKAIRKRKP